MIKKILITSLALFGLLLFEAKVCFADAAGLLEQAKNYVNTGWRQQAQQIYGTIVTDYPGSSYALEAQSELVVLDIPEKENSQIQAAIDSLTANYAGNPDLPGVLCNIAASFGWSSKYEEAIRSLSAGNSTVAGQFGCAQGGIGHFKNKYRLGYQIG